MASVFAPSSSAMAKPRRKLQKPPSAHRNSFFVGWRSRSSSMSSLPAPDSGMGKGTGTPRLVLPLDLSDSKWSDFLTRSSRRNSRVNTPLPTPAAEVPPPADVVPEFAHLAQHRPRPPVQASTTSLTDTSTDSSTTRVRRQAKTPVRSIGQLERAQRGRPGTPLPKMFVDTGRRDSALLLAQQYRDLLVSRNSNNADAQSLQELVIPVRGVATPAPPAEYDMTPPSARTLISHNGSSPTVSDNETLVGFQPDAVFFKPSALLPPDEPLRASVRTESRYSSGSSDSVDMATPPQVPASNSENLSFQLCLDLLTRELSPMTAGGNAHSTQRNHQQRTPHTMSALQILLMIEAYERLRNQVVAAAADSRAAPRQRAEAQQLRAVFDSWLRALYAVHDRFTGEARSVTSESDYEAFDLEDLE